MATKATSAIGSSAWISAEKENVVQLLQQEKDEVIYPAQHEMEWLNEHMAEIFSKSHVDVANIFKTPGKLRGKTPRTARKRNVQDARIPLSDVFSSKPIPRQSPLKATASPQRSRFVIAAGPPSTKPTQRSQVDSGYHGSSQSQPEANDSQKTSPFRSPRPALSIPTIQGTLNICHSETSDELRTTEGSFHSAKEDQTSKIKHGASQLAIEIPEPAHVETHLQQTTNVPVNISNLHNEFDDIGSPSDESTPDRPLVRKSSLTFASLPAREPLKKSLGPQTSRASHVDHNKVLASSMNNHQPLSEQVVGTTQEMDDADTAMDDSNVEILGHDDTDDEEQAVQQHSKSSTQRLHEKINMLGKAPPARVSRSVPSAVGLAASHAESLPHEGQIIGIDAVIGDDDDDWIKPLSSTQNETNDAPMQDVVQDEPNEEEEFDCRAPELIAYEERLKTPARMSPGPGKMMPGFGHNKSASTATLASPAKAAMAPPPSPAKSVSVSYPSRPTTTPQGSPRRYFEAPLSASKSKLQSIMKTAKGLFTSSASVSAAAKLETLSPNALRLATKTMPGMYPDLGKLLEDKPLPASPPKEVRRTRSSTEREKEEHKKQRVMQQMEDQLQKVREKERQKATHQKQNEIKSVHQATRSSPGRTAEDQVESHIYDMPPPNGHSANAKVTRPLRPGREPAAKAKPAPVSIRVGTLSQRMPSSITNSTQEVLTAEPKRPGLQKKPSNASIQSAASTTFKTSVNVPAGKPKALLAAEKKKEQDEREAIRKLEQKKEIERKRVAQQEEARKQEQKQRAEAEKRERERVAVEQAKRQAQQQAIERKRLEAARKAEQQRLDRATSEIASARPASRLATQAVPRSLINHPLPTNPAKPAKRPLEEENNGRPPVSKFGTASQHNDSKRRKTEDEDFDPEPRPTMSSAPIRQSHLGKKPSIFNNTGYAPAPAVHLNTFPQPPPTRAQPPQMAQFATSKIPFADAPNPPQSSIPVNTNAKTPASVYSHKSVHHQITTASTTVKSSPQYPNGDQIHLPEIPTDSEDEDSDEETNNAFPVPDWATPGHLTDQLIRQEGMDGDAVFGPIAPLRMEEIFAKGSKERLKRLRDRTSSANWAVSGDGLTLEEVRVDREQREHMRLEGGWRYGL